MSFHKHIRIANKIIAEDAPVFIIAEAGVNHNGDVALGKKLIDVAKEAGADAVKFQTFKAENLNTEDAPKSTYHIETTGEEDSWFNLLKSQELDRGMHEELIQYCHEKDIMFLSTPYDEESVDLLDALNIPAFKIASTDANNIPFLRYLAGKKKPILLSTAMCTLKEVEESLAALKEEGCEDVVLFHCTANYPTRLEDVNMLAMRKLKDTFDVLTGYSDHTPDNMTSVAAVALGAVAYEKHITLDKNLPGPDHRSSLNPEELKDLVKTIRKTESLLGMYDKKPLESEQENRLKLRKSIVAKRNISEGETLDQETMCMKRPAAGLEPKALDSLLGKKVKKTILKDQLITLDDVE